MSFTRQLRNAGRACHSSTDDDDAHGSPVRKAATAGCGVRIVRAPQDACRTSARAGRATKTGDDILADMHTEW